MKPQPMRPATTPALVTHVMVEYSGDRRLSINHEDVTLANLEDRLREVFDRRTDKTLFIAGDGSLPFGEVIHVIDAAKGAGVR